MSVLCTLRCPGLKKKWGGGVKQKIFCKTKSIRRV